MQAVETELTIQKIVGALAGAANTTDFYKTFWWKSKLPHRILYLGGNSIMTTTGHNVDGLPL